MHHRKPSTLTTSCPPNIRPPGGCSWVLNPGDPGEAGLSHGHKHGWRNCSGLLRGATDKHPILTAAITPDSVSPWSATPTNRLGLVTSQVDRQTEKTKAKRFQMKEHAFVLLFQGLDVPTLIWSLSAAPITLHSDIISRK